MSIKVRKLIRKNKAVGIFLKNEWKKIHYEHFGTEQQETLWKKVRFIFKAIDGKTILGALDGDYMAGVMLIDQLIVEQNSRGKGIGEKLIQSALKLAEKQNLHKVYLYTGHDWHAVTFYEKMGFIKETVLKNMYEKKDFIVMTKNIKNAN